MVSTTEGFYSFHLFSGSGGGIIADNFLKHVPVGAVEIEPFAVKVLLARQIDGSLPTFPIWDDIKTFKIDNQETRNDIEWLKERKDQLIICGGFPCTDISIAGKGAGISGEKSGLWKEMWRVIHEIRPKYVFVENSPMLVVRGLSTVLADLATIGYNAEWTMLGASDVGAPHKRKRIWILATNTDKQ